LADEACHQRAVQLKRGSAPGYQEHRVLRDERLEAVKAPLPARRIERLERGLDQPSQASVGGEPLGVVDGGRFEPASNRPPEQDPLRRALNFWCRMAMESPDFEGLCPGVVVSVGIEPGVPWSAVAAVLQRLASLEVRYVRFLFEGLATTSEPPRGAFYKEVEALHDIKRTQVGPVPARKKLFASCPLADDVEILLADEGPRLRRLLALAWPTASRGAAARSTSTRSPASTGATSAATTTRRWAPRCSSSRRPLLPARPQTCPGGALDHARGALERHLGGRARAGAPREQGPQARSHRRQVDATPPASKKP
jgi:hypothetical protein